MEDDFKLGVVIPYYRTGRLREVLFKELVNLLLLQKVLESYIDICIYEDGSYSAWLDLIQVRNFKVLRDKLIEPYYIDTIYHYNFGIDNKCLSYQAQLERGDRLND